MSTHSIQQMSNLQLYSSFTNFYNYPTTNRESKFGLDKPYSLKQGRLLYSSRNYKAKIDEAMYHLSYFMIRNQIQSIILVVALLGGLSIC